MKNNLENIISNVVQAGNELPDISGCILENLNNFLELRPYQKEAFSRFIYYYNNDNLRKKPTHLLYQMATGSGKTIIMAGLILFLYSKGYRNFIFFVNNKNIIQKTKDNFLNAHSIKYLFNDNIVINNKKININEVSNFQCNISDININFTTIQGLHNRINNPKENSITYEDFIDKKIVMISDEAHHINTETKKKSKLTQIEKKELSSWEKTVNYLLRTNVNNILLDFTATIDFKNQDISDKYFDKIIFYYPLKKFRLDKYSKDVEVLQSDISTMSRALQACLLSQYRRKIFEKNKINIKPVVLFKSKTIEESVTFYNDFNTKIKQLSVIDLENLNTNNCDKIIKTIFNYFSTNNISLQNIVNEFKEDFSEQRTLLFNSKTETEINHVIVNTLEDKKNEYRLIFVVDKLNEGWDVLNLFDIVRLYDTRDPNTKKGTIGKTTMSEAQLIGRGARYCPFISNNKQEKFKRKFDDDINNELRICELLYYHSKHNVKYISELHKALVEIGIESNTVKEINLELKNDFKDSTFYKNGYIYINKQLKHDRKQIFSLPSTIRNKIFKLNVNTGYETSTAIFDNLINTHNKYEIYSFLIRDFDFRIVKKALNNNSFYEFSNLKSFLPNLNSISEFIKSDNYLNNIHIEITGPENYTFSNKIIYELLIVIIEKISKIIINEKVEYKGTEKFYKNKISKIIKDKVLHIDVDDSKNKELGIGQNETLNERLKLDLSNKDWYAFKENYGTSEEKYFVRYINEMYNDLKKIYSNIYLVRNERHFKLFNFSDGRPFEPDYILFLKKNEDGDIKYYQAFIEPKGNHLLLEDQWKEDFLLKIKDLHSVEILWKNKELIIWGLPFYNEQFRKIIFDKEFRNCFSNSDD